MKKKNIILGSLVLSGVSVAFAVGMWFMKNNENGSYKQEALSVLEARKADEAQAWLRARYVDAATGQQITAEKLAEIQKNFNNLPKEKTISWEEQGPDNIGGRTRAIEINRNNPNDIWAGGVSGGLLDRKSVV